MIDIKNIQNLLKKNNFDAWLIYDCKKSNDIAYHILKLPHNIKVTRRFFYFIPKNAEPIKIVSSIEPNILKKLPGVTKIFNSWKELNSLLKDLVSNKKIAMEYSKNSHIPYISKLDAGMFELLNSFNAKIESSKDFLLYFTSILTKDEKESHFLAANFLDNLVKNIWDWIRHNILENIPITEYDVQQKMFLEMKKNDFITEYFPTCAVNENSADPHYDVTKENSATLKKGDFFLIDLWCKYKYNHSIYADITRVAVIDEKPTEKQKKIFDIVKKAQQQALGIVKKRFLENIKIYGYEVDDAARDFIKKSGFGKYFIHRTGHSIDRHVHGSGTYMDNLEMHDDRPILPMTCFSIEPGIYLPGEFGIRLEYDVLIDEVGKVFQTGGSQDKVFCILKNQS